MSAPSYSVPALGEVRSTAEPKIRTALSDLKSLLTDGVDDTNIATGGVGTTSLAASAVTSTKLADSAVIEQKLADSAVTAAKIADGNVTATKLASSSVASYNIVDGTIVDADVSSGAAVAASKLDPLLAQSTVENLKILRGQVASNGTAAQGPGWSSVKNSTGNYTVTFTAAFAAPPAVTLAVVNGNFITLSVQPTASAFTVVTTDGGFTLVDRAFNFIAIGPRS